jgi:hypothetical protein
MNPAEYKKKIENELINEFLIKFYEKVGYYPTVVTNNRITDDGVIVLTLPELEKFFVPYLPSLFGKKLFLGSKSRNRSLVELRCIFFFIGRTMRYSLKTLGTYLGGRDHTTVIHNITTFSNLYDTDAKFREKYYIIINQIKKDYESSTMDNTDQASDKSKSDLLFRLLQGENPALEGFD